MEKVSFFSEGHKLSGYIRIPKAKGKKVPGIVCAQGYGGFYDLEVLMQDIGQRLSEAGYATLIFYHRGLGDSEGPKGRVIPVEQAEDIRNGITYLQTRIEVDTNNIGLYGTSFGGANVVYAAAMDKRAKCVVSTGGIGDCERWLKSLRRRWEWMEFLKKVEEDRMHRVLTGNSQIVDPYEIVLPPPEVMENRQIRYGYLEKFGIKGYPLETADAMLTYKPELVADRISPRAVMWIHTGSNVMVPPEESLSMYDRAKEPKKLVILEGYVHYDVYKYKNPVIFEKVMTTAIDWFKQYLPTE